MSYKVGIIGQTGQLARALIAASIDQNLTYISLNRHQLDLYAADIDILSSLQALKDADVIINAAAYTAVDKAETESDIAFRVNAEAPELIAQFCQLNQIGFIHISTDYVFNGAQHRPYRVDDITAPLGTYGHSKLRGEALVRSENNKAIIIRPSWVYDDSGKNFMTTMLSLAQSKANLNIVDDQLGRPTYAADLAQACLIVAQNMLIEKQQINKIYHISNNGPIVSWAGFAQEIFSLAREHLPHDVKVNPITTEDYPTPAARPKYSALDVSQFETDFNHNLPDWRESLKYALESWAINKIR